MSDHGPKYPRVMRCSKCDTNWPTGDSFTDCPRCGEATWETNDQPTFRPEGSAYNHDRNLAHKVKVALETRRKRQADFEAFYEQREVNRLRAQLDAIPTYERDEEVPV